MKPCQDRHSEPVDGCRLCWLAMYDQRYRERWGIEGDAEPLKPFGLGDKVERLAQAVGADRLAKLYEKVTGRPCGCKERKEMLNRISAVLPAINRLLGKQ